MFLDPSTELRFLVCEAWGGCVQMLDYEFPSGLGRVDAIKQYGFREILAQLVKLAALAIGCSTVELVQVILPRATGDQDVCKTCTCIIYSWFC